MERQRSRYQWNDLPGARDLDLLGSKGVVRSPEGEWYHSERYPRAYRIGVLDVAGVSTSICSKDFRSVPEPSTAFGTLFHLISVRTVPPLRELVVLEARAHRMNGTNVNGGVFPFCLRILQARDVGIHFFRIQYLRRLCSNGTIMEMFVKYRA